MKRYLSEFIGTFILVFCGTGAIIINQESAGVIGHAGIAATFGLVVTAMIYALGPVSGAHLNPAVTLSFYLAKKISARHILPYIVSQISGAFAASIILKILFEKNDLLGTTIPAGTEMQSFVLEFILALILMFVIMFVAHGSKEQGLMAGIAIGAVILLEAMFAGPISGASMNPARSLAPAVVSGHLEHLWVYLAAPTLGCVFGMLCWKMIKAD